MRFKVISEKGAYLTRSPDVVRLELGADSNAAKAYGVRAMVYELLPEGAEIEGDHLVFGPHLEPLDDAAKAAAAAYWKAHPNATLDPTRSLPLGRDPMVAATFESTTLAMLERMAAEAAGQPTSSPPASDPRFDALADALVKLTALVTAMVPPTHSDTLGVRQPNAGPPPPSPRKAA